jgi:hypothetical protein
MVHRNHSQVDHDRGDGPVAAPPAASLLDGEAVASTWPLEPLTTANDPQGRGKTGFSLGNHRVEVAVDSAHAAEQALVVKVVWRRRPSYARGTTSAGALPVPSGSEGPLHHRLPRPETEVTVADVRVVGIVESTVNGAAPAHTLINATVGLTRNLYHVVQSLRAHAVSLSGWLPT